MDDSLKKPNLKVADLDKLIVKADAKPSVNQEGTKKPKSQSRPGAGRNFRRVPKEYTEKIIDIARVTNVVKGGRRFSFSVYAAVGNKKGRIGLGHGKSNEVPDAIKKALSKAQKNLIQVPIVNQSTIPHEQRAKLCASRVLLKPAPKGRGIIASGTVRTIVELAGYQDICTKTYGSRNKKNVAQATIKALTKLRTLQEIATLRDKEIAEII